MLKNYTYQVQSRRNICLHHLGKWEIIKLLFSGKLGRLEQLRGELRQRVRGGFVRRIGYREGRVEIQNYRIYGSKITVDERGWGDGYLRVVNRIVGRYLFNYREKGWNWVQEVCRYGGGVRTNWQQVSGVWGLILRRLEVEGEGTNEIGWETTGVGFTKRTVRGIDSIGDSIRGLVRAGEARLDPRGFGIEQSCMVVGTLYCYLMVLGRLMRGSLE